MRAIRISLAIAGGILLTGLLLGTLYVQALAGVTHRTGAGTQVVEGVTWVRPGPAGGLTQTLPITSLMQQDFEGAWPAPGWRLEDRSEADGGEYLPGKRDCHPRSGDFAGWLTGGGAQGSSLDCPDQGGVYPNNANTWAIYGPFDLSRAVSATLEYYFWGQTERAEDCSAEALFVGRSFNGTSFGGTYYCGAYLFGSEPNNYYRRTLDLAPHLGRSQTWIAIAFHSNSTQTFGGMMVDDLRLRVTLPPTLGEKVYVPVLMRNAVH